MTSAKPKRRVLLAVIGAAHGIRGEIVLGVYTDDPLDVAKYGALSSDRDGQQFTIEKVRLANQRVLARIRGVEDRNAAEKLRGTKLYADRAQFAEPLQDEFYHVDLIGLEAVVDGGEAIGTVVAVRNFGAGDMLELQPSEAGKPTVFVPFTNAHVPDVDLDAGRVVVILPQYTAEVPEGG